MLDFSDRIGNYLIIIPLLQTKSGTLYQAEHISQTDVGACILCFSALTLAKKEEQQLWLEKSLHGSIVWDEETFAIEEAGFIQQHPYLIIAPNGEAQQGLNDYLERVDKTVQDMQKQSSPNTTELLAVLLQTITNTSPSITTSHPALGQNKRTTLLPIQTRSYQTLQLPAQPGSSMTAPLRLPAKKNYETSKLPIQSRNSLTGPIPAQPGSSMTAPLRLPSKKNYETSKLPIQSRNSFTGPIPVQPASSMTAPLRLPSLPPKKNYETAQLPILTGSSLTAPIPAQPESSLTGPVRMPSKVELTSPTPVATPSQVKSTPVQATALQTITPASTGKFPFPLRKKWSTRTWQLIRLVILLLVALAWGGRWLYSTIPASSALITITPVQKRLTHSYTLTVKAATSPDPLTIPGRQLTNPPQKQTQTVTATGHGTHAAMQAKGTLVISQIHLTNPGPDGNSLESSTIPDRFGLKITTDKTIALKEGATINVPAHTEITGPAGNIVAHDIDENIILYDHNTGAQIGTASVANPDPFTGGSDAADYTFVQQSDLDTVTHTFTDQMMPQARTQVQQQLKPDEHLVQDPQCTVDSTSNHKANDEAGDVTIDVSVTCQALAYTDQAIRNTAITAYQHDGNRQFGSDYQVVGNVLTSQPAGPTGNTHTFTLRIDGVWSYAYTAARQKTLKNSIAGKTQNDALPLLQERKDIKQVNISTSGWFGNAIPKTPEGIKIIITHAVSASAPAG